MAAVVPDTIALPETMEATAEDLLLLPVPVATAMPIATPAKEEAKLPVDNEVLAAQPDLTAPLALVETPTTAATPVAAAVATTVAVEDPAASAVAVAVVPAMPMPTVLPTPRIPKVPEMEMDKSIFLIPLLNLAKVLEFLLLFGSTHYRHLLPVAIPPCGTGCAA